MFKKTIIPFILLLMQTINICAMSAHGAVLIDAENGRILYEHNAFEKRGMASTTKIMTAIVTLENTNPSDIVTVSYKAANTEGSSMYLKPNEKLTVENLLYGLMLNSGNDAATALAEHISGTTEKFAELMNKKAKEIGMNNSSFANPHGLDDKNHYSTPYDMALLTKYAMQNEDFKTIVGTKTKIIECDGKYKYLTNHNKLLSKYQWCKGVKTGFTKKCGRCLVSYAEKDGVKLIAITLSAADDWNDHIYLYESYFDKYKSYNIINKNDFVGSVNVKKAAQNTLDLYCCKSINLTLTNEEFKKIKIKYNYPDTINAPVYCDQVFGDIEIILNDKIIASSPVVAKYGVNKETEKNFKDNFIFLLQNILTEFKINAL